MRHDLIFFKPEIPISFHKDIPVIGERLAFASVEAKVWSFVISLWNRDGRGITVPREITLPKKVNDRMIQYIEKQIFFLEWRKVIISCHHFF